MALSYLPYILKKGLSQSFFIQPAPLTEKNVPDQTDRVFIITGGYGTGVGFQLADILYGANGVVWIAGRSESKAAKAIEQLTARHPNSAGKLHFLNLDLSDLTTIKPAVSDFLRRNESGKLHWLNNNAGVMVPPAKSTGAQGYDLQYVTNIYGPFLLTKLLLPTLRETARAERVSTQAGNQKRQGHPVRVSWAGSTASYLSKPRLGIAWTNDGKELVSAFDDPQGGYAVSKAANWYLANEFGRRHGDEDGVMHNVSPLLPASISLDLRFNDLSGGPHTPGKTHRTNKGFAELQPRQSAHRIEATPAFFHQ